MKRLALLATFGALAGFALELAHQRAGVWVLGQGEGKLPIWIPGVYFGGLLAAGLFFRWNEQRAGHPLRRSRRGLVTEVGVAAVLFVCPPLFHTFELGFAAALSAYLGTRLILHRARGDLLVVAFVTLADLGIESALLAADMFHYTTADFLPLPLWLAPFWASFALTLRRLCLWTQA